MVWNKFRVYLVIVVVCVTSTYYYWFHGVSKEEETPQQATLWTSSQPAKEELSCQLPILDPFDPSISAYIHKEKALECRANQPKVTTLDEEGTLQFHPNAFQELRSKTPHVICKYYDIWLADDNTLAYGPPRVLKMSVRINTTTCLVQCLNKDKILYENVHIYPRLSPNLPPARDPESQPSVLLLAIDSMSQPNFIRQLPKTFKYLTDTLGATVLKGMTKVGDNTFPNILTLLTGLRVSYQKDTHEFPWPRKDFASMTMDEMPLLWYSFREAGYLTLYAEDMPQYALFNYVTMGFLKTPVDYYMRPFWLASENTTLHQHSKRYCFGSTAKHKLILRYASQFLRKHAKLPYFAFAFISEITHDYINMPQLIDNDVLKFLQGAVENRLLDDSILIVMGDHGNRFDAIRGTVYGRLEERMPFFSIRLPHWLQRKHPHLQRNLQGNTDRLTSWFDVHEMLLDVNMNDFQGVRLRNRSRHGISLFRHVVPANRSCALAGIFDEYCVCVSEQPVQVGREDVLEAATVLLHYINGLLKPFSHYCYALELKSVKSAAIVVPNKSVNTKESSTSSPEASDFRIVIETSPNDALLEGLLRRKEIGVFEVSGDVIRINAYKDQSICIRHAVLRSYCLCRQEVLQAHGN